VDTGPWQRATHGTDPETRPHGETPTSVEECVNNSLHKDERAFDMTRKGEKNINMSQSLFLERSTYGVFEDF